MEPKSKMVSFRLSPREYAEVEGACRAHGYRSISLFGRYAILAFHDATPRSGAYEQQISELRERIDTMAAELIRLSERGAKAAKCGWPACPAGASCLYETAEAT